MKLQRPPSALALSFAVLLLGVFLRLYHFAFQSLWYDEVFSVVFSSAPTIDQLLTTLRGDFHPPLYFVALRYWLAAFGTNDETARLLSVAIGVAGLCIVDALARTFCARDETRVPATALFITATSLTLIWYAQEVRQYGLLFLTGAAALHSTLMLLQRSETASRQRIVWALLYCALSYAGLIYTHYAGVLALCAAWVAAAANSLLVWRSPAERSQALRALAWLVLTHAVVAALFLPWLPTFLTQRASAQQALWIPTPTILSLLEILPRLLAYRLPWDSSRYNWLMLILSTPVAYTCLWAISRLSAADVTRDSDMHAAHEQPSSSARYDRLSRQVLIASWIVTPIATAYALSLGSTKIFYFRNLIYVSPALAIALATLACHKVWGRGLVSLVVAASFANVPWYYHSRHKEDWRRATPFITERITTDSSAIFDAPGTRLAFDYYAHGASLPEYQSGSQTKPARIFYVRALSATKVDTVIAQLQVDGFTLTKRKNFPGIIVIVFDR
jgi:uncharacterized membrane protein